MIFYRKNYQGLKKAGVILVLSAFFVCNYTTVFSQTNFNKFINTVTTFDINGVKMKKLSDGGYMVVTSGFPPWVFSSAYGTAQIMKFDSVGTKIFNIRNTPAGIPEYISIYDFAEDLNGDLVFVGFMRYTTFGTPMFIFKTDSNGNLLWSKITTWGGTNNLLIQATGVYIDSNNNISVISNYNQFESPYKKGFYFVKTTSSGIIITSNIISGDLQGIRYRGYQEPNGDFVMPLNKCGVVITDSNFVKKAYFSAQINYIGTTMPQKVIKGYNNDYIVVSAITDATSSTMYDASLACFDSTGQFKWFHRYPSGNFNVWAWDVVQSTNQTYTICVSREDSSAHPYSSWLLRVDSNGNLINSFRSSFNGGYYFMDKIAPNEYLMTGWYQHVFNAGVYKTPMSAVVTDSLFQDLCLWPFSEFTDSVMTPNAFNTGLCVNHLPPAISLTPINFVLNSDAYQEFSHCIISAIPENISTHDFNIFPNPFKDHLVISTDQSINNATIILIDAGGRKVYEKNHSQISPEVIISTESLPHGFYIMSIITKEERFNFKMVK